MTELLTLLGAALALTACLFPSLLSVGIALVPRPLRSTAMVLVAGAVLVIGVNAAAV